MLLLLLFMLLLFVHNFTITIAIVDGFRKPWIFVGQEYAYVSFTVEPRSRKYLCFDILSASYPMLHDTL